MYVLEDLWLGNIDPSGGIRIQSGSPYAKVLDKMNEKEDAFYPLLPEEGKQAYRERCTHEIELAGISDCDSFVRGFRLGARMILDVVGEYRSPMERAKTRGTAD